jgi:hypothetical protein
MRLRISLTAGMRRYLFPMTLMVNLLCRFGKECTTQRHRPQVGPDGLIQPNHATRFNVCVSLPHSPDLTHPPPAHLPKHPRRQLNYKLVDTNPDCLYALMICIFIQIQKSNTSFFITMHFQLRSLRTLDPASSSTNLRQDEGFRKIYE